MPMKKLSGVLLAKVSKVVVRAFGKQNRKRERRSRRGPIYLEVSATASVAYVLYPKLIHTTADRMTGRWHRQLNLVASMAR